MRRLLLPLTPLYRLALAARDLRLRRAWDPVRRLNFPVIGVGNLSTGGAGKTPFVVALARSLSARGFAVDVLSRGYGRTSAAPARVDPEGTPDDFGDEPLLIARETDVPVYVARERLEAGLLAEGSQNPPSGAKPAAEKLESEGGGGFIPRVNPIELRGFSPGGTTDSPLVCGFSPASKAHATQSSRVHILDDAFQHRQLHREVDLLLMNHDDWHDRLLPAGNLREPLAAARRAHVICIPQNEPELERQVRAWGWQGPVWRLRRRMEVPPVDGPVVAFCGIARPEQFFAGLEAAGLQLAGRVAFPDHHRYTPRDLYRLRAAAHSAGAAALITTGKDLVRMATLADARIGNDLSCPTLSAGLTIEIEDEAAALEWLIARVTEAIPPAQPV